MLNLSRVTTQTTLGANYSRITVYLKPKLNNVVILLAFLPLYLALSKTESKTVRMQLKGKVEVYRAGFTLTQCHDTL